MDTRSGKVGVSVFIPASIERLESVLVVSLVS